MNPAPIKRYDFRLGQRNCGNNDLVDAPNGQWVRWEDVKEHFDSDDCISKKYRQSLMDAGWKNPLEHKRLVEQAVRHCAENHHSPQNCPARDLKNEHNDRTCSPFSQWLKMYSIEKKGWVSPEQVAQKLKELNDYAELGRKNRDRLNKEDANYINGMHSILIKIQELFRVTLGSKYWLTLGNVYGVSVRMSVLRPLKKEDAVEAMEIKGHYKLTSPWTREVLPDGKPTHIKIEKLAGAVAWSKQKMSQLRKVVSSQEEMLTIDMCETYLEEAFGEVFK